MVDPAPVLRVALPVGISFYTFQSVSYTIDVYRGHVAARRNLVDMGVFVSFFPHLVAGPIMRASSLLPQVERERRFSASDARDATMLLAWGFFKKLVIADNVGVIANKVFALQSPEFAVLWAGVFAFAIQIYADFSAYTDIARGTARWLGFDLVRNFDHPYLASGPTDFWRRWNISLTTWFRDYVFLPLSFALSRRIDRDRWLGVRDDIWIYAVATMATFLLSGLWHGASWNFVLWGGYHGVLLVLARALSAAPPAPADEAALAPPPAHRRHVRADVRRLAAVPGVRPAHARPRPHALAVRAARCSGARPAPTCSCWRSCTRCRCGSRACGPSGTGGTWYRRCPPRPRSPFPRGRRWPWSRRRPACAACSSRRSSCFRSRTSLDFIYFQF